MRKFETVDEVKSVTAHEVINNIGIVVILIVHMVVPLFRSVSVPAMVK